MLIFTDYFIKNQTFLNVFLNILKYSLFKILNSNDGLVVKLINKVGKSSKMWE